MEAIFLGYWIGDGYWRSEQAPEVLCSTRFRDGLEALIKGLGLRYSKYVDTRPFRKEPIHRFNFFKRYGQKMLGMGFRFPCPAWEKEIPEGLMNQPKHLLSGLWMSDGTFSGTCPQFFTTSQKLSGQVRELMAEIGFDSGLTLRHTMLSGRTGYYVYLRGKNWKEFQPMLSLWGPKVVSP